MIQSEIQKRILILDGAMGTMIQQLQFSETAFRGEEFANNSVDLKGNNDILTLTQPKSIRKIHQAYIEAGADIIETNTFNSNSISQATYHCSHLAYRLNYEGAQNARLAIQESQTTRKIWIAGSIGPTTLPLSCSSDVKRTAYESITFNQLTEIYSEQICGLIDGGVDLLLVETVLDSRSAQAALYAIKQIQHNKGTQLPVMLSATINPENGHIPSGENLESLYTAISDYPLFSFGLNCSYGATNLLPFMEEISKFTACYLSVYPNAGLPNAIDTYDETPQITASFLAKIAQKGGINIVGGCCGTTPAHIHCIRQALQHIPPRIPPTIQNQFSPTHTITNQIV